MFTIVRIKLNFNKILKINLKINLNYNYFNKHYTFLGKIFTTL